MLWSGSSPMSVVRANMWSFLLFAGVAWLAVSWSVLRLDPADVAGIAGPMVLFGALCEAMRALAGARTWWLNAGMAVLFAATGVVMLTVEDASFVTPASLAGWFLMVRGAADIVVSAMNRGVDRTWGLVLALGVVQAGTGFFATGPAAQSGDLVVVTLGALGLLRGVADLVTALRLREVTVARDVLALPPERAAGVAGYAAGLGDYESVPSAAAMVSPGSVGDLRARHRAQGAGGPVGGAQGDGSFHDEVVRMTAELDARIAQAGVPRRPATHRIPEGLPPAPDDLSGLGPESGVAGWELAAEGGSAAGPQFGPASLPGVAASAGAASLPGATSAGAAFLPGATSAGAAAGWLGGGPVAGGGAPERRPVTGGPVPGGPMASGPVAGGPMAAGPGVGGPGASGPGGGSEFPA